MTSRNRLASQPSNQPAAGQPAPATVDPAVQALADLLQEAHSRELTTRVQLHAVSAHLTAEKKRADEAEAKLLRLDRPK